MADECCVPKGNVMILACSGGSNVGQLANQAAVELTLEGFGKMYCLAGVGGLLSGFVQSAKDAPQMLAIDGCAIGCARSILENADVALKGYVVVTELGIEKNHDFALKEKELRLIKEAARQACPPEARILPPEARQSTRCCGG
jgi:uncharacterized metal-binding protein